MSLIERKKDAGVYERREGMSRYKLTPCIPWCARQELNPPRKIPAATLKIKATIIGQGATSECISATPRATDTRPPYLIRIPIPNLRGKQSGWRIKFLTGQRFVRRGVALVMPTRYRLWMGTDRLQADFFGSLGADRHVLDLQSENLSFSTLNPPDNPIRTSQRIPLM